ncbi:DUF2946 family protein [Roseovarius sp. CAU 1744]|uniref:DUF2946 family protein n=1 Tax=Roseovarius sp. CAU 1744 TaxID=3140368 RepID=UPI00325ABAD3
MSRRTHSALRHLAIAVFLLLPLVVMSAFPHGTMAVRGASGLEVVLCTGDGPLTVIVDENGAPIDTPRESADCGWSLLGQNLCLPVISGPIPPISISGIRSASPDRDLAPHRQAVTPYPARAPPTV